MIVELNKDEIELLDVVIRDAEFEANNWIHKLRRFPEYCEYVEKQNKKKEMLCKIRGLIQDVRSGTDPE